MRRDVELSNPMKREREHDSECPKPTSKRRRSRLEPSPPAPLPIQQEESLLPTPAHTVASPELHVDSSSYRPRTPSKAEAEVRKQTSRAQSGPKRAKRALDAPDCDQSATKRRRKSPAASDPQAAENQASKLGAAEPQGNWFCDNWLANTPQSRTVQEKVEGIDVLTIDEVEGNNVILTVEGFPDAEAASIQMSQLQDAESTQAPGSAVSERLKTSSPMYRGTLKMNGVIVDNFGTKIPRDVQDLVTKHIRQERKSPRLGEEEKARILRKIEVVWDSPEPRVSDIVAPPLFPFDDLNTAPSLAQGGDILWSPKPLPRSSEYLLVTPKTDRHLGYQTTLKSNWTRQELAAADHPKVRPYSQPTRENLFPSFLIEVKSEATGGTSYAAEAQLATAGFHRVSSLLWVLDQINPNRSRSSCDAIVFSAAVSQRQAIAHVHYYNPDDDTFYMSFIDSYYYAKDVQGCRDFGKNVEDWLLEIQQPIVRDALKALHPITQLWKKARSASAVADEAGSSFGSDSGRSTKNQRRL